MPLCSLLFADLNARTRLLAACLFACAVAVLSTLPCALAALFFALGIALGTSLTGHSSLFRLHAPFFRLNIFFLLLLITMPLRLGADPRPDTLLALGPLQWGSGGLQDAIRAMVKGNAILLLFLALPGTSSFSMNCRAMLELGMPEKLVTLLQLVARHTITFTRELHALRTAAALRGFTPRCTPHTWRTLANLAGMLLVRGYDKSLRIERAMRLRGFNGRLPLLLPDADRTKSSQLPGLIFHLTVSLGLLSVDLLLRPGVA